MLFRSPLMTNKKPIFAAKYFSYIIFIILLFVLQTTPGFLTVLEIKPNFVIPAAVCIAMREGEFLGGLYGAFVGILCDLGGFNLFGLNAILLLIAGVACGLLTIYLLQPGLFNFLLLLAAVLLARGLLDYLLNFLMWGYENVWMVLAYRILPGIAYSLVMAPLVYLLYERLYRFFQQKLES